MRSIDKVRAARHHAVVTAPLEREFRAAYVAVMRAVKSSLGSRRTLSSADLKRWQALAFDHLTPLYRKSLVAGAADILGLKGIQVRVRQKGIKVNKARKGELERVFEERVDGFIETTYEALQEIVSEAEADDLDPAEIGDLVDEEFSHVLGPGADLIAATEVGAAVGSARDYVMRQVVDLQQWMTAGDERVRENHVVYGDADPTPVGFNYATLVGEDYELKFPVDPDCDEAGEVVNCRCFAQPVGDVEMDPEDLADYLGEFGMDVGDLDTKGFVEVKASMDEKLGVTQEYFPNLAPESSHLHGLGHRHLAKDEAFEAAPVETLRPTDVEATDMNMSHSRVQHFIEHPSDKVPYVAVIGGQRFLVDGHHRAAASIARGGTFRAHVLDVTGYQTVVPKEFDEAAHPRGGDPANPGRFSAGEGGGGKRRPQEELDARDRALRMTAAHELAASLQAKRDRAVELKEKRRANDEARAAGKPLPFPEREPKVKGEKPAAPAPPPTEAVQPAPPNPNRTPEEQDEPKDRLSESELRAKIEQPVKEVKAMGAGIHGSVAVTFQDGTKVLFKSDATQPEMGPGLASIREAGAWEAAKVLDMRDLASPCVYATLPKSEATNIRGRRGGETEVSGPGAFMSWQPGDVAHHWPGPGRPEDGERDSVRAQTFDYFLRNTDRHQGNWMVHKGEDGKPAIRLIDHGFAYPARADGRGAAFSQMSISPAKLSGDKLDEVLGPYRREGAWDKIKGALLGLGIEGNAVEGAGKRFAAIAKAASGAELATLIREGLPRDPEEAKREQEANERQRKLDEERRAKRDAEAREAAERAAVARQERLANMHPKDRMIEIAKPNGAAKDLNDRLAAIGSFLREPDRNERDAEKRREFIARLRQTQRDGIHARMGGKKLEREHHALIQELLLRYGGGK